MTSLFTQITALEAQRALLSRELDDVTARLDRVRGILTEAKLLPAKGSAGAPAPKGAPRRAWFKDGEALTLMRKIVKKPMSQIDIVRALGDSKGYTSKLPEADLKRFQFAAYSAIRHGVVTKKLTKTADGMIGVVR